MMVMVATTAIVVVAAANACLFVGKQVVTCWGCLQLDLTLFPSSLLVVIVIIIFVGNPNFMNMTGICHSSGIATTVVVVELLTQWILCWWLTKNDHHTTGQYSITTTSLTAAEPIPPLCHHYQHPSLSMGSITPSLPPVLFLDTCTQDVSSCFIERAWWSLLQDVWY